MVLSQVIVKMGMCDLLEICLIREELRSVEDEFGDLYVTIISVLMMLIPFVGCLVTSVVVS